MCIRDRGKEAVLLKEGDVVNIPAGIRHWHGAVSDSWFSHLAIEVPGENCSTEWLEAVSDGEYNKPVSYTHLDLPFPSMIIITFSISV